MAPPIGRSILGIALLAAGCTFGPDRDTGQVDRAEALWASKGVTSYEIVVRRFCFCATVEPVRVTVVDGQVVSRVFVNGGQPLPAELARWYPDVPGLFAVVREAFEDAASVNASFDETWGYPTSVVIDYIKNAIDDEVTINTSGFVSR